VGRRLRRFACYNVQAMQRTAVMTALLVAALAVPSRAEDPVSKAPAEAPRGKICEWKSEDGLAYQFRVPENYDADKSVNLTFILHGSNLDRRWGFANHSAETFRPDDVVVSPDGTTPNGQGGFNLLNAKKDLDRMRALHEELAKAFNVRATYLYGHSQGSFFAFLYAGEFPAEVQGVVGHASGPWGNTTMSKKGHHQAIVLLHGTGDPVVPYWQSRLGFERYEKAKYPLLRLRALEGWNHWPAEHNGSIGNVTVPHTSQQLAYVEGMTTTDPDRLSACFEFLSKNGGPHWHDYAALRAVAHRIGAMEEAPQKLAGKAKKTVTAVDKLAAAHVKAITKSVGKWKKRKAPPEKDPGWVHLLVFLRDFRGVPAADALRGEWQDLLDKHRKAAEKRLQDRWKAFKKDDAKAAFEAGLAAAEDGFVEVRVLNWDFLNQLRDQYARADELKLSKKVRARYDALVPRLRTHLEKGVQEFMKVNAKEGPK